MRDRARWMAWLYAGAMLLAGAAVVVGLSALLLPPRHGVAQALAVMPPGENLPLAPLPHAWISATPVPSLTPTPWPTLALRQEPPRFLPTLTPLPTPPSPPTASPTPLHPPAEGDPTRITAAAIGLDVRVSTVAVKLSYIRGRIEREWAVPDYVAGFHGGMARPGHVGNTVLNGHVNVRGEVFRDIAKLQPGDEVVVWVGEVAYPYRVSFTLRVPVTGAPANVQQDNLRWLEKTDDERLTLITCWPYTSNTHRTIVVAFPAPLGEGKK